MEHRKIGFAFCGSFCTYSQAMEVLERVQSRYGDVLPSSRRPAPPLIPASGRPTTLCGRWSASAAGGWWTASPRPSPLGPGICWMCWSSVPARATPWPSWQTASRTPRLPWRPRLTCATGAGGALPCHQRRSGGLGQEYRRTAGQEKRLFRPLPAGRSAKKPTSLVADFPWSQPLSTRRWRAASSSPCCLDRRRRIKKHTAPGVAGGGVFL